MHDFKIGAAYIRVSTDKQEEYSPDSQLKLIRDYAAREGYVIPEEYIYQDDGISGKRADKRPQFMRMIAEAKEKTPPFDCIYVWKYSRFARNQEESLVYKNLLKKNGVAVRSISEPSADDNPFSGLIESIISWMDEYYLINLSTEVKRGMKEKASRGEATGRAPYGYKVVDKTLVPDENADNVRYIFELCASGLSFRQIAIKCDELGIKTKKGKSFNAYDLRYILRNPAYIGKIRWSEEEHPVYRAAAFSPDDQALYDGKHDPLITGELWEAVQKRINRDPAETKYVRKDNPVVYMAKGLLRCDKCGGTLTRHANHAKTDSLQCYRYTRGQCQTSHSITIPAANAAIIEGLEAVVRDGAFVFAPQPPKTSKKIAHDWDKLIHGEKKRIDRAKNAMYDGAISIDEYKELKASAEENIAKFTQAKEKDAPHAETINIDLYKKRVLNVIDVLKSPDVSEELKNTALREIIDKIVYKKPENTFVFYFR